MSSPTRMRSWLIHPPPEQQSHSSRSVGVPGRDTSRIERAGRAASMPAKWWATADSVIRQIKGNGDADVKPEGAPCLLAPYIFMVHESTNWKQPIREWKIYNLLCQPFILVLNYILCQMKDATINVYDWLAIEVRGYCFMGHWAPHLFKGCKDEALSCRCHAFQLPLDCLIMWGGHFSTD